MRPWLQYMCQGSRSTPPVPIQMLHPFQPSTPTQPVPSSPLSHTPIKQLQPTQILAPPQPVSLPPISTLSEKDEPEPEQQEPEPEQQEPEPEQQELEPEQQEPGPEQQEPESEQQELESEQHEPDYGRDKFNQQFKSCMRDFNKNVLKRRSEYMSENYKTSFM